MDPIAVVQRQVDAYNARDLDRFLACYSPDATIEDGDGHVRARGYEAIGAFFGRLFEQSPALHVEVLARLRVGGWVVDEERVTGRNLVGAAPERHQLAIYLVANGQIVRSRLLS